MTDPHLSLRIDDYHAEDIMREEDCSKGGRLGVRAYRQTSDLLAEVLTLVDAQELEIAHLRSGGAQ